jgi:phenylacetate-CoA ligase
MTLLQDAEWLGPAELARHRQASWEGQRRHVMGHSDFYRALWQGRKPPKDLRDLPDLPLSSKAQLRESQAGHPPFGNYLASVHEDIVRLHRTSGTTGQAMNLALSAHDCEVTATVGGRCYRAAGLKPGHRVVHCLNYQMWMGGVTDHLALEASGATVVPFGVGDSAHLIRTVQELSIDAISCTPSYPAVLEAVLEEKFPGLAPRDLGLKLGLFGGEPGLDDPNLRERLRATWGLEPRNANFGVSDAFSIIGAQCEENPALHFLAGDVLYPELIDPEREEPLSIEAGREGELVLTHLARHCQPLVRFRTGDIVSLEETSPCRCGRTTMRFRIVGRADDMVVVRGLNLFPTMVAAVVNDFPALSGDYRIVLDKGPPYDFLPLQVELAKGQGASDSARKSLGADVAGAIKKKLGASARVVVLPPGSFPVTAGKTRRVVRNGQ